MDEWLTIKQIAEELAIPESNLRYYRDKVSEFLASTGKGRKRRYSPEATDVFRTVIEMVRDGVSLEKIYVKLSNEKAIVYPKKGPQATQQSEAAQILNEIKAKMQELAAPQSNTASEGASREAFAGIESAISRIQEKIAGIEQLLSGRVAGFEDMRVENERLRQQLPHEEESRRKAEELVEELREKIRTKERIIQIQRDNLMEDRKGREQILGEIQSLRARLDSFSFRKGEAEAEGQGKLRN